MPYTRKPAPPPKAEISKAQLPASPTLGVPNVAHYMGVDPATVIREIQRKKLPAYKIGGQWRVSPADLKAYLDARKNMP